MISKNRFTEKPNIKLMIVIPALNMGGAERVATYLANHLVDNGYEITFLVMESIQSEYKLNEKIILKSLNSDGGNKIVLLWNLRNIIKTDKPDVVLCFSIKFAVYAIVALLGIKACVIASDRSNPYFAYRDIIMKSIIPVVLSHANGLIFINDGSKGFYSKVVQKKSIVIPNGIFNEDIPDKCLPFECRDFKKICAVGRLAKVKNYEMMLRAFSIFHMSHIDVKLHIFGKGDEIDSLVELAKLLNIDNHVIFEGVSKNIPTSIMNASMFIHTSISESWGNSIMEAMACGIPCVAMDCDFGPREMIRNDINGILVKLNDIDEFASAMCRIADSKEFARSLSENAIKIRELYDPLNIVKRYDDFIRTVLRGN